MADDKHVGGAPLGSGHQEKDKPKERPAEAAVGAPGESLPPSVGAQPTTEPAPPLANPGAPTAHQEPIGENKAAHHETPRDKEKK